MYARSRRAGFTCGLALLAGWATAASPGYLKQLGEWREKYEQDLRLELGPLFLIGRFSVPEGRTTVGSGPENRVTLPARAPKSLGVLDRRGEKVVFEPAANGLVTLRGKPVPGAVELRTGPTADAADRLVAGDFTVSVVLRRGNWEVTVRDRQSPFFRDYRGSTWFAADESYRVRAAFHPYTPPKTLQIGDTTGGIRQMEVPGYVTFRLKGEDLRLEPTVAGKELFFMFKDRTAGKETYGAGRFLDSGMPKDGEVVLDFNQAYNPWCAFNPYTSCPIPPKQNNLPVRIEAGEKLASRH